jgi:dTDP-4-amino-4,6-dideoxygalactose transaminase
MQIHLYKRGMVSVTEAVTERIVSLPIYPELTVEQREWVVNSIKKQVAQGIV